MVGVFGESDWENRPFLESKVERPEGIFVGAGAFVEPFLELSQINICRVLLLAESLVKILDVFGGILDFSLFSSMSVFSNSIYYGFDFSANTILHRHPSSKGH